MLPLIVDLDGTLIRTDMLHESALFVLQDAPRQVLFIPIWLRRGKALLKQRLAQLCIVDPASLPYNAALLDWLRQQRGAGRRLILCTASDISIAAAIAAHLGLFDEVMASDGLLNLEGARKAAALVERYGVRGFDYVGNSRADLHVWKQARRAIVVNAPASLATRAAMECEVALVLDSPTPGLTVWARALRVRRWPKNLLMLLPLLGAHSAAGVDLRALAFGCLAFCLCASASYLVNDLFNLRRDRHNAHARGFAAGEISIVSGICLVPLLSLLGLLMAAAMSLDLLGWLMMYLALSAGFSWRREWPPVAASLTRAVLTALRLPAGAAALGAPLSALCCAVVVMACWLLDGLGRYVRMRRAGVPW